jgi:hypothetical protein
MSSHSTITAKQKADVAWANHFRDKALADYGFAAYRRMLNDPKLVKEAITGEATWYGAPGWYPDEGGEDLTALEEAALDKLDGDDLGELERACLEAALDAIDDFRQQRKNRED